MLCLTNTKGRKYDSENAKAYYKPISPTEWYENQSKNIGFGDIKRRGGSKNNSKNSILDLSSNNKGLDLKNTNLDFDLGNGKNGNSGKNQNNANLDLKSGTAKNTKNGNNQNSSKNANNSGSNNTKLDLKDSTKNTNSNKSNQTKNFKDILDYNTYQASLVEDRDNAKIMKRPLDLWFIGKMSYKLSKGENKLENNISKVQHEQIFFEDEQGGNIGFFKNGLRADDHKALSLYEDTNGIHYNDAIMRKAVERLRPYFPGDKYSLTKYNCQTFTHSVVAEYYRIMREEKDSLKSPFK